MTTLIVVEFSLSHIPFLQGLGALSPQYDINGGQVGDFAPDQDGLSRWRRLRPYSFRINRHGFRTTFGYDLNDQTRRPLRVMCIGDSFTFGSYVNDDQAFPYALGRLLEQQFGPTRVEVINAGFGAYTIQDELDYYLEKGRRLKPDLVVLAVYAGNDVRDMGNPSVRRAMARTPRLVDRMKRFLARYALYNLAVYVKVQGLVKLGRFKRPMSEVEFIRLGEAAMEGLWPQYASVLTRFIEAMEEDGVRLLITVYPHYFQLDGATPTVVQNRVHMVAARNHVQYVDLLPAMKRENRRFPMFNTDELVEDDHPTAAGHRVAAYEIYRLIVSDPRLRRLGR